MSSTGSRRIENLLVQQPINGEVAMNNSDRPTDEEGEGERGTGSGSAHEHYSLLEDLAPERKDSNMLGDTSPKSPWFIAFAVLLGFCTVAVLTAMAAGADANMTLAKTTFHCSLFTDINSGGIYGGLAVSMAAIIVLFAPKIQLFNRLKALGRRDDTSCCKKACVFFPLYFAMVTLCAIFTVLAAVSILMYVLSRAVPDLNKSTVATLRGLNGTITIVRDLNGLTHIQAESQWDAVFGQGFVHAEDRLWQLEFDRLAAKGQLAEHVGAAALKFDKQTRALNFIKAGELLCQNLTAEEHQFYQRYADGINFYFSYNPQRPPEFLFMSKRFLHYHEPSPFTVSDVCLSGRLLQWRLSLNVVREVERFKIYWNTDRTYEQIWELYVNFTNISSTVLSPEQMGLTEADAVDQRARQRRDKTIESQLYNEGGYIYELRKTHSTDRFPLTSATLGGTDRGGVKKEEQTAADEDYDLLNLVENHASNAWVGRGKNGQHSCQASDPHLQLTEPSIWYYAHLIWPGFETAGVGLVGIPGIHIGKTTHVSWGITMSMTDLQDLYLLIPSATRPETHYQHNGVDIPYTNRTEVIKVKGGDPVTLHLKDSLYGPVCTEAMGLPRPDVLNFAIAARPLMEDNTTLTSVYNMMNPKVQEAKQVRDEIFGLMQSPGFSIPGTDKHGNLVYTMTGKHIKRAVGHTGYIPTVGNGTFDWVGSIPFNELPTLLVPASPKRGAISCANQKMYPDGYKYTLGYDFAFPHRGRRLQELVNTSLSGALSNLSYHVQVQTDIQSNMWLYLYKPLLNNGTNNRGHKIFNSQSFQQQLNTNGANWFERLNNWDGLSAKGTYEPTFFWFWYREFGRIPTDVTSALGLELYTHSDYPYFLLADPTELKEQQCKAFAKAQGFSTNTTEEESACFWVAVGLFNQLADEYFDVNAVPLWGIEVNNINAVNMMMHKTPLQCMWDRQEHKDGDHSSIDVADHKTLTGAMTVVVASSMRQVYSWATPTWMYFALPGGENGNPFSHWYSNLLSGFANDKYVTVSIQGNLSNVTNVSRQLILPRV